MEKGAKRRHKDGWGIWGRPVVDCYCLSLATALLLPAERAEALPTDSSRAKKAKGGRQDRRQGRLGSARLLPSGALGQLQQQPQGGWSFENRCVERETSSSAECRDNGYREIVRQSKVGWPQRRLLSSKAWFVAGGCNRVGFSANNVGGRDPVGEPGR